MFTFFKNLFTKKEKPVCEYSHVDIASKAIHTQELGIFPTGVTCYQDRIVLNLSVFDHRTDADLPEMQTLTVTVPQTGERQLPFTLLGVDLFWDTQDLAFRRKLMPEGEPIELAPQVLIYPNKVLTIGRAFAEEYLSPHALSFAAFKEEERYIWYYPDFSSAPAVFEVPKIFTPFNNVGKNNMDVHPLSAHPLEVANHMATFTFSYLEAKGITMDNFIDHHRANLNRELPGVENN